MTPNNKTSFPALRRRDFGLGTLALGAAALLALRSSVAQNILERSWDEITGDLKDLPDDVREVAAYFFGMESYVFGYPLVMMDVTRDVLTAAPAPNADGTAPINQLAKMPTYVSPDFKNVVRISLNSLWTTGFLDLEHEPIVLFGPRHQRSLLCLFDHEYVDRCLWFGRQADDGDSARQFSDCRPKLEGDGAGGFQGHVPLINAICMGSWPNAGQRA